MSRTFAAMSRKVAGGTSRVKPSHSPSPSVASETRSSARRFKPHNPKPAWPLRPLQQLRPANQRRGCFHEPAAASRPEIGDDETSPIGPKQRPRLAGDRVAPLPLLRSPGEVAALSGTGAEAAMIDAAAATQSRAFFVAASGGEERPRRARSPLPRVRVYVKPAADRQRRKARQRLAGGKLLHRTSAGLDVRCWPSRSGS